MSKKCWIYIDWRNFEIWVFNTLWLDVNKSFDDIYRLNLDKFLSEITLDSENIFINYYRGIPGNNLFEEKIVKEVWKYINYLIKLWIKVYKWHFTFQKAEKWVDVRLALGMVRDSRDKKIDIIYLFSNDTDLIEAIKDVKTHWIKIFHCVFKTKNDKWYKPNNALSVNSDKRLILNNQLIKNFL